MLLAILKHPRHTRLQLVDGKFLISGYGLISLEAQSLTSPRLSLCLDDMSLLQTLQVIHFWL